LLRKALTCAWCARRSPALGAISLSYSILFGSCCALQKNQKESNDVGKPSKQQIAEAVIHSAQSGESDADFDARIAGLSRQSDAELAAFGIVPAASPQPAEAAPPESPVIAFEPVPNRRIAKGWTAARQRIFLDTLPKPVASARLRVRSA
jgi:hypothetical protein